MTRLRFSDDDEHSAMQADALSRQTLSWRVRAIDMSTRYPAHSPISNQWLCVARQVERARASIRKLKAELERGNHD